MNTINKFSILNVLTFCIQFDSRRNSKKKLGINYYSFNSIAEYQIVHIVNVVPTIS